MAFNAPPPATLLIWFILESFRPYQSDFTVRPLIISLRKEKDSWTRETEWIDKSVFVSTFIDIEEFIFDFKGCGINLM
jgi:hypothetical protein